METSILKDLGLTDSEIEVFMGLFHLGEASVRQLVKKAGKHRTNIYDTLEKLMEKGLVSSTIVNKVKYFYIANPYKLEEYFKEKENKFKKQETELRNFINNLSSIKPEIKTKQKIEVFKGIDGLRSLYYKLSEVAKPNEEVYIIGSVKKVFKMMEYYLLDISKKTANINIKGKMIASHMIFKRQVMRTIQKFVNIEIRFIDAALLSPSAIIIFKDFVGFFNYIDEPFTILINDKSIADSYRNYFNGVWKIAK